MGFGREIVVWGVPRTEFSQGGDAGARWKPGGGYGSVSGERVSCGGSQEQSSPRVGMPGPGGGQEGSMGGFRARNCRVGGPKTELSRGGCQGVVEAWWGALVGFGREIVVWGVPKQSSPGEDAGAWWRRGGEIW